MKRWWRPAALDPQRLQERVRQASQALRRGARSIGPWEARLRDVAATILAPAGQLAWAKRRSVASLAAGLLLSVGLCSWLVVRGARGKLHEVSDAPSRAVAVVFGAGVWPNGTLSPTLQNRVDTAVALYHQGQVERLLMSGDHRRPEYDEPSAMRRHAVAAGVPHRAIALDPAGFRTYATCARARAVFGIQDAVLVTQRYHLPRAVYTCRGLGIDAVGVVADRRSYQRYLWYLLREQISRTVAVLEVRVFRRTARPPQSP
jgi:vancomycin permeability regulator SanA